MNLQKLDWKAVVVMVIVEKETARLAVQADENSRMLEALLHWCSRSTGQEEKGVLWPTPPPSPRRPALTYLFDVRVVVAVAVAVGLESCTMLAGRSMQAS